MTLALTNADIAELLARRAEEAPDRQRARAYRRAASAAFAWPVEVAELVANGLSPTELPAIGTRLAARIRRWLEDPPTDVVVPEARRDFLTLTEARALIASEPEWLDELRGDLQMHTYGSDGRDSVAEMATAAVGRGYEYIAITDHTKGLKIAGGMDEDQFAFQGHAIAGVNDSLERDGLPLRVLRSAEVNLDVEGSPDMPPAFLAGLDVVIGSFHSALRKTDDQTKRYLKAVSQPHVNVLGHPRNRMYDRRAGLTADWARVFAAAAEHDTAVEIDGYPDRQDLQSDLLRMAAESEVLISLGTDAHSSEQLGFIEYSLGGAIKAGIARDRVVNYWPRDRLLEWAGRA